MIDTFLKKFLPMAFATNGLKNNIPVADPAMFSSASYEKGFPKSTMKKVTEGGIPPQGTHFNGVLNAISLHTVWTTARGTHKRTGELSNAIGGYAKGAVLVADNLKFAVISLVNNNKINFNTNPSSISPTGPWRLWCDSETLDTIVPDLRRRMGIAEKNITNLQGRMTTAEGNIKNLQGRMDTAESNISTLDGKVSTLNDTTLRFEFGVATEIKWFMLRPPEGSGNRGLLVCTGVSTSGIVTFPKTFWGGSQYHPEVVLGSIQGSGDLAGNAYIVGNSITNTQFELVCSPEVAGANWFAIGVC